MGGHRASRGVNLIKDLRENPTHADHQEALRLWMAYSQIETRAQFVRLLGLGNPVATSLAGGRRTRPMRAHNDREPSVSAECSISWCGK